MSQEAVRFAQAERESLLAKRRLYQAGSYWKNLYETGPVLIASGPRGVCEECGTKGQLYALRANGESSPMLCKVCMTDSIRSFLTK